VRLAKDYKAQRLGVNFEADPLTGELYLTHLTDGPAKRSGRLAVGDCLKAVNGRSVFGDADGAHAMIRACEGCIELELQGWIELQDGRPQNEKEARRFFRARPASPDAGPSAPHAQAGSPRQLLPTRLLGGRARLGRPSSPAHGAGDTSAMQTATACEFRVYADLSAFGCENEARFTTLDAKWLKKPLGKAVIDPFLASLRIPGAKKLTQANVLSILVDGQPVQGRQGQQGPLSRAALEFAGPCLVQIRVQLGMAGASRDKRAPPPSNSVGSSSRSGGTPYSEAAPELLQMEQWAPITERWLPMTRYPQLELATGSFASANKVGQGGCGSVYGGVLPDGTLVAVKRFEQNASLAALAGLTIEHQVQNELSIVTKDGCHSHFVPVLAFSNDGPVPCIVYGLMQGGCLEDYLRDARCEPVHGRMTLGGAQRLRILCDVARGLTHLHDVLEMVHRDVKSSNVLLDGKLGGKLGDFGLCCKTLTPQACAEPLGTIVYMAPEYKLHGQLSVKVDVFAFTMVMLEALIGLPADFTVCALVPEDPRCRLLQSAPPQIGYPRNLLEVWLNHIPDAERLEQWLDRDARSLVEIGSHLFNTLRRGFMGKPHERAALSDVLANMDTAHMLASAIE